MPIGYVEPGVQVTQKTEPSSIQLSNSFRKVCIIGRGDDTKTVSNEAVIRSSTGAVDNLVNTAGGIVSLVYVGDQVGLKNYVQNVDYSLVGNQVNWLGVKDPTDGATYYVTYTYTRPASDYKYKEFDDYAVFTSDMGSPSPTNLTSLLSFVGVKQNLTPFWATVQVKSPYSYSDFVAAIELTKNRDVQDIVCLTTDPTIHAYAKLFVNERSLPQNKKRRIAWNGTSTGVLPGDLNTAGTISGYAYTLKNKRNIYVSPTRAKVKYDDSVTKLSTTVVVDGSFIAGAVAMYRSSILDPAAPLLGKQINGLEFYDEDLDVYFSDTNMNKMATAGVMVLHPVLGVATIRDDLTTDQSDIFTKDINIITATDYVDTTTETKMNARFIGNKIVDQTKYLGDVKNYLIKILRLLQTEEVVSSFDIADIKVWIDPNAPTDILYSDSWVPIFVNKRIFGSYVLKTGV